jgi:hypothetical protein
MPEVSNEEDLGRHYVEELEALKIPEDIEPYFDYEAYGDGASINNGGVFINGGGYVEYSGDFTEYYKGRDDIPEEYRIFAYPDLPKKMPIKARIEMYGSMVSDYTTGKAAPDRESR